MRVLGWIMIVLGAAVVLAAFSVDVSVSAPGMEFVDPALKSDRVANWDLMAQRSDLVTTGAAIFLAGWIALAVHAIGQGRERATSE